MKEVLSELRRIDEEEQEEGEIAPENYDLATTQESDHNIAFIPLGNPIDSSESIIPATAAPIDMVANIILPPQSLVPNATFAKRMLLHRTRITQME